VFASLLALAARVLLAAFFLGSAYLQLMNPHGTIQTLGQAGVPMTKTAYVVGLAVEFLGGLLLLLGSRCRLAALGLAVFLVVNVYFLHFDFATRAHTLAFLKNLAVLGGLLHVAAHGGGRFSLERG
jgi:putative oxidoreductase